MKTWHYQVQPATGVSAKASTKAGDIVQWLKTDYDLGQGHAMAIYALLKGIKDENSD